MTALLIIWYIFCFFYGTRVTDYFFIGKPKTRTRTIAFIIFTAIMLVIYASNFGLVITI